MKIPNLVASTLILFISNLLVRVMGFIYKIFLSNTIGELGLGLFHMVFNLLMICISITTTGIPTALSCLVARKNALKDKHATNALFISALYTAFFISMILSFFICIKSNFLAFKLFKDSTLNIYILAIAPAITLITLSNIIRGYYYGIKKVMIPAIGQVLEQVCRIIFVFLLIYFIKNPNANVLIALLGISIGEIINIIFMTIYLSKDPCIDNKYSINMSDYIYTSIETLKMSLPITCNRTSSIFMHSITSMIIPSRLVVSGMSYSSALSIYGVISGMVIPFVSLPFTLGSALVVNLIPSISQEFATNRYTSIMKKIKFSLFITFLVGLSSSLIFLFLGEEICLLIFKNKLAGYYLKLLYLAPLFMALNHTLSAILHGIGKEYISSINNILGMILQLAAIYILVAIPSINIYGYICTLNLIPIITFIFNFIVLFKTVKKFKH